MALYILWLAAAAAAVCYSWWSYRLLAARDAYQRSLLAIQEAPLVTDDFDSQSQLLCQACIDETAASGCALYLQPGYEETGFRRAAQAGISAEETGTGAVKDLLTNAWQSGEVSELSLGGRYLAAVPVWHGHNGGGALIASFIGKKPGETEISLLKSAASVASIMAPRFMRESALDKAHEEIQLLKGEVAQESYLAGVGRLAAGVAHELSQPLTAVLTMVGSLSRSSQDPVSSRRLRIIQEAVQKCKSIIEKLVVYSKNTLEKENDITFSRFVRAYTDMNQVVADSLELLRDNFADNKITPMVKYGELPKLRANSTQWSQALANILAFLRDCLLRGKSPNPAIQVATSFQNGRIRVSLAVNSFYISENELSKIFDPFFINAHPDMKSCIGLTLVREVVNKHNGAIEAKVDSNRGMIIVISIPVEEAE